MAKIWQMSTTSYRARDFGAKHASFIVHAPDMLCQQKSTGQRYEGNQQFPKRNGWRLGDGSRRFQQSQEQQ